jgi:probable HAF family extracellular repeat protein
VFSLHPPGLHPGLHRSRLKAEKRTSHGRDHCFRRHHERHHCRHSNAYLVESSGTAALTYTYTTVDDPFANTSPEYGTTITNYGINNEAGQVVGNYWDGDGNSHGFIYSSGTYTTLDGPSNGNVVASDASGINASGEVVGSYFTGVRLICE